MFFCCPAPLLRFIWGRKYDSIRDGSVAEWLKAHDSKSCGQQCLGGSNPLASAMFLEIAPAGNFLLVYNG